MANSGAGLTVLGEVVSTRLLRAVRHTSGQLISQGLNYVDHSGVLYSNRLRPGLVEPEQHALLCSSNAALVLADVTQTMP